MSEHLIPKADDQVAVGGQSIRVAAKVLTGELVTIVPATEEQSEDFTEEVFEDALDKASRPTGKGKLAHLRPNSEEFARRKQEEIDLEERRR